MKSIQFDCKSNDFRFVNLQIVKNAEYYEEDIITAKQRIYVCT